MTKFAAKLLIDWTPISERIITAGFYSKHVKMTILHVYAPTENAEESVKNEFYERLHIILLTYLILLIQFIPITQAHQAQKFFLFNIQELIQKINPFPVVVFVYRTKYLMTLGHGLK